MFEKMSITNYLTNYVVIEQYLGPLISLDKSCSCNTVDNQYISLNDNKKMYFFIAQIKSTPSDRHENFENQKCTQKSG